MGAMHIFTGTPDAKLRRALNKNYSVRLVTLLGAVLCQITLMACHSKAPSANREPLDRSAWVESAAVQRGYVKAGDFAQFGCPPGWMSVEETAAALRGGAVSTTYVGPEQPRAENTVTCVAQREFSLPAAAGPARPVAAPAERPLSP